MEDFLEECAPFQTSESHYAIARPPTYPIAITVCKSRQVQILRYNLGNYDF